MNVALNRSIDFELRVLIRQSISWMNAQSVFVSVERNDPSEKVWVPKEQWFETPAEECVDGK